MSHRLRAGTVLPISLSCVVDPVIPDLEVISLDAATDTTAGKETPYSYKSLQTVNEQGANKGEQLKFMEQDKARYLLLFAAAAAADVVAVVLLILLLLLLLLLLVFFCWCCWFIFFIFLFFIFYFFFCCCVLLWFFFPFFPFLKLLCCHIGITLTRGLFRVWFLLLEGLTSSLPSCPREHQSMAVDSLFETLHQLQKVS